MRLRRKIKNINNISLKFIMLTDNNQIFRNWFIIHSHLTKVSAQIIQCIIFERNESHNTIYSMGASSRCRENARNVTAVTATPSRAAIRMRVLISTKGVVAFSTPSSLEHETLHHCTSCVRCRCNCTEAQLGTHWRLSTCEDRTSH